MDACIQLVEYLRINLFFKFLVLEHKIKKVSFLVCVVSLVILEAFNSPCGVSYQEESTLAILSSYTQPHTPTWTLLRRDLPKGFYNTSIHSNSCHFSLFFHPQTHFDFSSHFQKHTQTVT